MALKEVGCFDISMGIEAGCQRILDEIGKKLDVNLAAENVQGILNINVDIHATFIVGIPSENQDSKNETLNFITKTGLKHVSAGILTPFPDTKICNEARIKGGITDEDEYCSKLGHSYEYPYINMTNYSNEQLLEWRYKIDALSLKSDMAHDEGFNKENIPQMNFF